MTQDTAFSGTAADVDDDEISLLDLLQVVVENLRLLVLGPLAAGVIALGICFIIPPTFTATTVIMPPQQQQSGAAMMLQSLGALGGLAGAATGLKNPNDQFVSLLKGESVANGLIDRFGLVARYEAGYKVDARKTLDSMSRVTSGKDGLITIEVDDKDPVFAAQLANGYITEFDRLLDRLALTDAQQRRVFFEKQLQDTKTKLDKAEIALQSSGVNGTAFKASPEAAIKATAEVQALVAAQEVQVASMRAYLTESAPEFKQGLATLAALRMQLAKLEKSSPTPSAADADYVARYRDVKYFETLFEAFSKQFEMAKVDEAREGANTQVVDPALPPERKSKPKKGQVAAIAALAAGFLLLLFVFVRQSWQQAAVDPQGQQKLFRLQRAWAKAVGR